MNKPVDVVIVGGGTAGWMAAAALVGIMKPELCRVRLVESEEIGTVGVGEATLPHMKLFNDSIGLDEAEMMRRTNATFKLGIEFVDWGFEGASYIHPFGAHGPPGSGLPFQHLWLRARQNGRDFNLEEFSYGIVASRRNRFDFPSTDHRAIDSTYGYAYHFDASLYAKLLRSFAEARGARRTEGKVAEVVLHPERGDIASLTLDSGEVVPGDFFIDCSGFRSLLLGDALGVEFEDWSKWLPCDRAFAVPSAREGALTPYTRSTARAAGWQWRIPLQHRTGNGYVFSSSFISEDEAADTLMRNLGSPALGDPKLLRFKAGRRLKSWQGNCLGLGLASGFLEPLESTSIYLIQMGVLHLLPLFPRDRVDPRLRDEFNRRMDVEYSRIRDFLILHYHANTRDDAELWRYCRAMEVPDSLVRRLELFRHRGFIEQYRDGLFTPASWLSVYTGQGVQPEHYHPTADAMPLDRLIAELEGLKREIDERVERMPAHEAFIGRYCAADAAVGAAV
jgi:tryptophan halogenase